MLMQDRTHCLRALSALSAAVALLFPSSLGEMAFAAPLHRHTIAAPTVDDDGLVFFGGPVILSNRLKDSRWMQFSTDPCGLLQHVEGGGSVITQSGFPDSMDDFDEDDPSDLGREMIGTWLSTHPEISVINDGVDKECDDSWFDDEDLPGEFEASRTYGQDGSSPEPFRPLQIA